MRAPPPRAGRRRRCAPARSSSRTGTDRHRRRAELSASASRASAISSRRRAAASVARSDATPAARAAQLTLNGSSTTAKMADERLICDRVPEPQPGEPEELREAPEDDERTAAIRPRRRAVPGPRAGGSRRRPRPRPPRSPTGASRGTRSTPRDRAAGPSGCSDRRSTRAWHRPGAPLRATPSRSIRSSRIGTRCRLAPRAAEICA